MTVATDSTPSERDRVVDALVDEFLQHAPGGRRFLAVDGGHGAGKAAFADAIADALGRRGVEAVRASLEGFAQPLPEPGAHGRSSALGYYREGFDLDGFRARLVLPFRAGATDPSVPFETSAFDLDADATTDPAPQTAGPDAVLVVDGPFVHRPELKGIWHFSVWLEVPIEERRRRLAERAGGATDADDEHVRRIEGAEALYWDDAHPNISATAIVDNADPSAPVRRFADFCVAPPRIA